MDNGSQYSIHSICRICLIHLQNDNAYDLFMTPGLAKKLCVCTSLSVEPQDGFPKNLCGICYARLNDLHDFQKLCVDSVQKFQEMVTNNSFACMPPVNTFDILEPTTTEDLDNGQNPDDDRINFDPLLHHKMELIENEDEVFKMLEHVDKEDNEEEEEEQQNATIDAEKSFDSTNDMFNSESSEDSDDDDEDYTNDNDNAAQEDSSSDDDMPLALRLRKKQNSKESANANEPKQKPKRKRIPAAERHLHRIIDCHICHQKFKKRKCYQEHMKYHNDKLPFQCSVETCQKGFTTANGLRMHVDHAHSELSESHPCPEDGCGQVFPRSRLLTWHLRKVHNKSKAMIPPKMHPCSQCEKVFRCPMALKKHMYKHDGKELPFPCNICGKRFVINSALKEHLMRHAGIKNYVCPYCGVGKTTRQEWNNHINMHTQEKKYQCHLCEHSSHNKQALTNHVRVVHEKIKNYACQYCGKTFGKSHACKIHEMTHTGEKRCECKVCGKRFLYPKSLTKHLKTHEKRVLRAIEVYRKRQEEMGETPPAPGPGGGVVAAAPPPPPAAGSSHAGPKSTTSTAIVAAQGPQGPAMQTTSPPAEQSNQNMTEEILKACAESVATIPKDPRRVERVDISQLAGTAVNPIPQVAVPSWSPQVNFTMKEGKHICPGCGKGFNNIGNMKRHYKIIHEKVKDFACRFCERRFAKAQTLRHHEMTHTGEKPYECKVCLTRFRQDVALKRHMKVHQNRPPVIPAKFYAAREELALKEREELDAKRKAEMAKAAITEAAREQLMQVKAQIETEKMQKHNLYDRYGEPKEKDDNDVDDVDDDEDDNNVTDANANANATDKTGNDCAGKASAVVGAGGNGSAVAVAVTGGNASTSSNTKKRISETPEKFFATQEELALKEREEVDAKCKAEMERAVIAEAAREQLMQVKAQMEFEKMQRQNLYDRYYEQKTKEVATAVLNCESSSGGGGVVGHGAVIDRGVHEDMGIGMGMVSGGGMIVSSETIATVDVNKFMQNANSTQNEMATTTAAATLTATATATATTTAAAVINYPGYTNLAMPTTAAPPIDAQDYMPNYTTHAT